MKQVIDSNILLDYPTIIENNENQIIIPIGVLKELDELKKHSNRDIAFNARRASVYISRMMNNIIFDTENYCGTVDEKVMQSAKKNNATVITNDNYLKVLCNINNVDFKGFTEKDDYSGIEYVTIPADGSLDDDINKIYTEGILPENIHLYENEYLVLKCENQEITLENGDTDFLDGGIFVYRQNKLLPVKKMKIENKYINKITPRNLEQMCLFEALEYRNSTIVYAGGGFGRGKSFILNNFALQELEKGRINKIIYVPNNSNTENTMELGALPGDLLPKVEGQIGPLIDLIGIDRVRDMMDREQLEVVPMGFIRGRSFQDSIVIVNESQNLTEDHIKLLIARCGEGTRIFFDGDVKQADSQIFRNKNGLKLLLNLRRSPFYSQMFSTVKLTKTERSQTAQAAEFLDSLM